MEELYFFQRDLKNTRESLLPTKKREQKEEEVKK
jgi:hypothetical protein